MNTQSSIRMLQAVLLSGRQQLCTPLPKIDRRCFHSSLKKQTDGVYKALTEMRVRTPWIKALRQSKEDKTQRANVPSEPAKPDLAPKRMSDSYFKCILPLAQDPWLLDTYANSSGQIRLGTLLMDLDALSGVVAYKHTGEGVTTVTAAVDRITIKNPLKEICDLELSGQVTFATGRSSMEISLQIAKAPSNDAEQVGEADVFMTCAFTMVSLDPVTKKPVNVAPLKLETEAERQLYARGEENYNNKKALKHSAITQKAPNAEESVLLHKMWTDSLAYRDSFNPAQKPDNVSYMSKATVYSAQIMQPQYRNRHNFMIFGGYLLKQTFELAFTCAAAFSHTKPSFLNLDPSTFENPVPVGSVLYLSAGVTFTEPGVNGGTRIQVIVTTKVRNVEHQERKSTGTFFYTFHVDNDVRIMPQTYDEFMRWVDGRRRAQRVTASLKANGEAGNTHDTIGTVSTERVTE